MQHFPEVYIGPGSLPKDGQTREINGVSAVKNIVSGLDKPV
jgi:hypothetical protein